MTVYTTSGVLKHPVNDIGEANAYLQEDAMAKYLDPDLSNVVEFVEWSLTDEQSWKVTVVANRDLTTEESERMSDWISGQNSDGLGEGFEQQPFAEVVDEYMDDDDEGLLCDYDMASFDWEDNPCTLTKEQT